jgi:peptidoglycan/xylan/chitin deacetylase (PgdA/CDA1 family)
VFKNCIWGIPPVSGSGRPQVALTVDDGPHPDHTPRLLDLLDRFEIRATFFLLGERVEHWPAIVDDQAKRGHQLGLHGYRHVAFPSLPPPQLQRSLHQSQQAIAAACGGVPQSFQYVRCPNGLFLPQTLQQLQQWGFQPVMWSVVPEDWLLPPVSVVVDRVLRQIYPGALIVLHDGPYGGSQVVQILEQLLPVLLNAGYEFAQLP